MIVGLAAAAAVIGWLAVSPLAAATNGVAATLLGPDVDAAPLNSPRIRLAVAGLCVVLTIRIGPTPAVAAFWVLAAALVALCWFDVQHLRLPREISYTALAISTIFMLVDAAVTGDWARLAAAGAGAAGAGLFMLTVKVLTRGIGSGDVRVAPLLGAHLGWLHLTLVPAGLLFAFTGLSVFMLATKATRPVPFGPFLAAGTIAALVAPI